jgi:hypothetical protein
MKRMIKDAGYKIIMIPDNPEVHHSKPVKECLSKHVNQIEVFYESAYSSELNPSENLNNELEQVVNGNHGSDNRSKAAIYHKTFYAYEVLADKYSES